MSSNREVKYEVDFRAGGQIGRRNTALASERQPPDDERARHAVPRIARLMALAIRFDGLLRATNEIRF